MQGQLGAEVPAPPRFALKVAGLVPIFQLIHRGLFFRRAIRAPLINYRSYASFGDGTPPAGSDGLIECRRVSAFVKHQVKDAAQRLRVYFKAKVPASPHRHKFAGYRVQSKPVLGGPRRDYRLEEAA
jgi:hypothetical protein